MEQLCDFAAFRFPPYTLPGIDNVAEVRWQGSVVSNAGCLWIWVRFGEIIRQLSWPGEHLATLIRTIHYLNLIPTHHIKALTNTYKVIKANGKIILNLKKLQ